MEQRPMPDPKEILEIQQPKRPNEQGRLNIDDFVRIYDPNTQQIILEKRS